MGVASLVAGARAADQPERARRPVAVEAGAVREPDRAPHERCSARGACSSEDIEGGVRPLLALGLALRLVVRLHLQALRNAAGGAGDRLVERVMLGRREVRALVGLLGLEAPEPGLARLEAADERLSRGLPVGSRVL